MTYLEALAEFLDDQLYKGNSPATVKYYRERLERFQRETDAAMLTDFNDVKVRRWLMSKQQFSRNTVANYDRALRVFANWLHRQGYTEANSLVRLPKPREVPTQLVLFTASDIMKMLTVAKAGKNPLRDTAMIVTLLDTGIRIGEFAGLKLEQVSWVEGHLNVNGKTGERTVPFGRKCKATLKHYVDQERTAVSPTERHVFLNTAGNALGVHRAQQQFTRIARRADVKASKVGPHTMRHTFAVEYICNGGDAFSLQRILGHNSLEMTRKYVHLAKTDLREAHRRFSPGNRML